VNNTYHGVPLESDHPGSFEPNWEPVVKVRPMATLNIFMHDGPEYGEEIPIADTRWRRPEQMIGRAVGALSVSHITMEYDDQQKLLPALSSLSLVYPPVSVASPFGGPSAEYLPDDFFDSLSAPPWIAEPKDIRKAIERRMVWTGFYRRVSYGANSDPALYELIVVVSRRPSERHRFPLQDASTGFYTGDATLAPVPWLVTFSSVARPLGGFDRDNYPVDEDFKPLWFNCIEDINDMLPVGSIIIPARNDEAPDALGGTTVGFGPPAPAALPIYRVIERPSRRRVVVEYNGFYPMTSNGQTPIGGDWPVWIIPPAFAEVDYNGPVYEQESTIVTVARRYVRLHEVP
jgi:hypothetical protein